MLPFLYSFLNIFQPGILFPAIASYKPMLLISAIALMFSMKGHADTYLPISLKHPAIKYLVLFILVQAISVYYSGISAIIDVFLSKYIFIIYVVISIMLIKEEKHLIRYVWGLILGGMFIVYYGIYVSINQLATTVGGYATGAYGMYENHNDYTYIIILIFPFIYAFMRKQRLIMKIIMIILLLSCVVGILKSFSRGGILAFIIEIILLYIMFDPGSENKPVKKKFNVFYLAVILTVSVAVIGYQYAQRAQFSGSSYTAEDAKSSRLELWKAGLEMFYRNPFLGVGVDRFGEYAKEYYELSYDQLGKNAHNTYIQVLATTGLIGMLCYFLFIKHILYALRNTKYDFNERYVGITDIKYAAIISLYSYLFRALTNAKIHDWGIYMLCVIAVSSYALSLTSTRKQMP